MLYNTKVELEALNKDYTLRNTYDEDEVAEFSNDVDFVVIGAGVLQRGWCCRNLSEPSGYDRWFDDVDECQQYLDDMDRLGYGNTVSGPYILYSMVQYK